MTRSKGIPHTYDRRFLLTIFLLIVFAFTTIFTYYYWIRGADHRDFYPRWAGAKRVISGLDDLYSTKATHDMQIVLYGHIIPDDRDQQGFAYPAILLPIILPFALIDDVEIATALWEGFSVVLIILGLILVQKSDENVTAFPIILALFWFYTLLMIFQGQITGLIIAVIGAGYWAWKIKRDLLGGILISIGFIKPELVVIPILVLIILSIRKRRWRFLIALTIGFVVLFGVSFLLVGFWINDWLEALTRYSQYAQVVWPVSYIFKNSPWIGLFLIFIIVVGIHLTKNDDESLFAISIPLSLIFIPQTLIWCLSMNALPMTLTWKKQAKYLVLFVWTLGWIFAIGNFLSPEWWKVQVILVSVSVFLIVVLCKVKLFLDH